MAKQTNRHISRLSRFLPFDPSHDQIYEEYQTEGDSLNFETVAFRYVLQAIKNEARIIVLTGDAGHGKTHLCRRIIEEVLGYDEKTARELINEECDGKTDLSPQNNTPNPKLRVFKDFSEFAPDIALDLIENLKETDSIAIICANEGRLRAVLSSEEADTISKEILESFEASFDDGLASRDGKVHIVNLNDQSVAAGKPGESLCERALKEWTSARRWRACETCSYSPDCPVNRNRELLSVGSGKSKEEEEIAEKRKTKIRHLFATLERTGYVITIRDMLMAIAYLLTGGLNCNAIETKIRRKGDRGWQHAYAFYNVMFNRPGTITKEQLSRLPLMGQLVKLDPGRRAIREIDDDVINREGVFPTDELDLLFSIDDKVIDGSEGIDEVIGDPRNRKQRDLESSSILIIVRSLRRRAYFDGINEGSMDMKYLGFNHGSDFLGVASDTLSKADKVRLKTRVINGLHHIQGLQFEHPSPTLHLIDPAYGKSMSGTAVLAATINPGKVNLIRLSEKWENIQDEQACRVGNSVDWIDRYVVLRIEDQEELMQYLPLDLMTFDCILRASSGHVPTKFYEHDLRRVSTFLGKIAQKAKSNADQIDVVSDGGIQRVTIDDNTSTIQVGGG